MAKTNKTDARKSKVVTPEPKPAPDIFTKLGKKAPLLLLTVLVLISFIVFKGYILQDKYYLFRGIASDSVNGLYPYYYLAADHLAKYGMPGWSFNFGMGHSLLPFLFQDPFAIFLYIAGKDNIMSCMIYKELGKIILAGMLFFYYLKLLKHSDFAAIIGGLLFAFSGFMIVGSCWYLFSFEAFNFALLLLAFELLFTKGKWYLFPLPIFLICISQPVNLYIYGVFLALYAVFRLFHTGKFSARNLGGIFFKMAIFGLVGALLSGPFLLENVFQVLTSPRGSGAYSFSHSLMSGNVFALADKYETGTGLLRLFSNDLPGTAQFWNGKPNYLEAPEFYCGIPCLLLMPQVFGFLERRLKIVFTVFISFWFVGLALPYFRHAFWLFSGDYYRAYSFFGAFCMLLFALMALDLIIKNGKINRVALLSSLILSLAVLCFPFFPPKEELMFPDELAQTQGWFIFAGAALVIYASVLFLMSKPGLLVRMKYLLFILVVAELSYLANISVNNMEEFYASDFSKDFGYNDHQQDAINFIKRSDHSFFRIDKACSSSPGRPFSYNDGMVQDYKGTSVYNSFNQLYYVLYLQLMGIADKGKEDESRWATGLTLRPALESENSVKYILTKKFFLPFWRTACDSITTFGDVTVLRNKYALPFGCTYDCFIKESIFGGLSNNQKDLVSLRACVVKDDDVSRLSGIKEYNLKDTVAAAMFNSETYQACTDGLKMDAMTLVKSNDDHVAGNINVSENKVLYLSIPYDRGWKMKVDDKPVEKMILSAGMTGIALSKGKHTIVMDFEPPFLRIGFLLSIVGILFYGGLFFFRKRLIALTAEQ